MKTFVEEACGILGELAVLAAKTDEAERKILAAAELRLQYVLAGLERFYLTDSINIEGLPETYHELLAEKDQLLTIIARSCDILYPPDV